MAKEAQKTLIETTAADGPVECLGMTFDNDQARRKYFLEKLREHLKDPEFRKIEGFPVGEDEDILALSDPPYFTICPNPFLNDLVDAIGTTFHPNTDAYHREPFAADVSEGKNNATYNAHAYHTKVPHKAIIRYILHYTNPGDIVFDGFCGTGMTGVAAQSCGQRAVVESLGYRIEKSGAILSDDGQPVAHIGERFSVLNDLAPAATFIAHNYTTPLDETCFSNAANHLIEIAEREFHWLYETRLPAPKGGVAPIDNVIWSDVFLCPNCTEELVFWNVAVSERTGKVKESFKCSGCGVSLKKSQLDASFETVTSFGGDLVTRIKKCPVQIQYKHNRRSVNKSPDKGDLEVLDKATSQLRAMDIPRLGFDPESEQYKRDALHLRGIQRVADFYTPRSLLAMSHLWSEASSTSDSVLRSQLLWLLTSAQWLVSVMYRYRLSGGGGQQGKLTIPSLMREQNLFKVLRRKLTDITKADTPEKRTAFVSTGSTTAFDVLADDTIDYVFTDPPFGGNLFYTDLNRIWEGWLKVSTNEEPEAVVNRARKVKAKSLFDYTQIMRQAFQEAYRVLKPGRWITVEFHNSSNAVWNSIQEAIGEAGFVVADVRTLDKQQGTFKQVTDPSAVKQDLVISAYKPASAMLSSFAATAGTTDGCWKFIRDHLGQLPLPVRTGGKMHMLSERQNYLIFDRMVAFHVQRGVTVPVSATEFYGGLDERYVERDGMYFLQEQAVEYDKLRMTVKEFVQLELFVCDESSAIQWLKQQLTKKPQSFQELQPQFMREVAGWEKHEKSLELLEMLEQNFLCCDGDGEIPSQIHSYLSSNFRELRNLRKDDPKLIARAKNRWYAPDPRNEADLEKIRHRALMKEFEEYRQSKGKLKIVRTEALRAGFKESWQNNDYQTIVDMTKRVKDEIIQEDPALLMYFDNAMMLTGG